MTTQTPPAIEVPLSSRAIVDRPVELRAAPEGSDSPGTLVGYGAVFNSVSRDLGGWREVIDPGAFGAAVGEAGALDLDIHHRVICRTNHNSDLLLGTSDAETLRLFLDETGLRYEVDLPNTSHGRDLAVLAKRRDIRFSSFAFRTTPGGREWTYDEDDQLLSRVKSAIVGDVAPVADPAYWEATSEMREAPDLDAIRASLKPQPGPPGDLERGVTTRSHRYRNTTTKKETP